MNLTIDIGNSFIKVALFEKNVIHQTYRLKKEDYQQRINSLFSEFKISQAIVSTTGNVDDRWLNQLKDKVPTLAFNQKTKVPFQNYYKTPQTLGLDRMALVSAASQLYQNHNCLVIDAGTCITYDLINAEKKYYGGMISPGWQMRFEALHEKTDRLPLVDSPENLTIPGVSTKSAMYTGVVKGLLLEIDGFIDIYKADYEHLTVILTGGDSHRLSTQLKNDIFANSNFLMFGLNAILEYNSLHE
ncbi:MAG: type III pantothenate kinase [Psychroflexus sp.]|jgi:type III pantothenate kinase|nr:type III pantothenate kinase [Psychroflexus sp.]MDR9447947.1 type III pantothenate kinase [Psychroflexus sp.]